MGQWIKAKTGNFACTLLFGPRVPTGVALKRKTVLDSARCAWQGWAGKGRTPYKFLG